MSWDAGFAIDLSSKPVANDTTLNPRQADPRVAGTDKLLAHVFEQITRVKEEIARVEEKPSKVQHNAPRDVSEDIAQKPPKTEHNAPRGASDPPQAPMNTFRPAAPGNWPSFTARAARGFLGLLLAGFIGSTAIIWQSPSYGEAVREMIKKWAPELVAALTLTLDKSGLSTIQAAPARVAPTQAATPVLVSPDRATPIPAMLPSESTQLVQSMVRDLATLRQRIEQLRVGQEQVTRDTANLAEQIKTGREEMVRISARVSTQNARPKIPEPMPRPSAAPARKPMATLSSSRDTVPPPSEKTQVSSAPRAPMPMR